MRYGFGNLAVDILVPDDSYQAELDARFANFRLAGVSGAAAICYSSRVTGRFEMQPDGRPQEMVEIFKNADCVGIVAAGNWATLVEDLFLDDLMQALPAFAFLHAGVVARGEKAVVLSGRSGAGKSTLSCALQQRGFSCLSDDMALIDPTGLKVYPYPANAKIRRGSFGVLGLAGGADAESGIDHMHVEVPVPSSFKNGANIHCVLSIAYAPACPPSLTRLEGSKALQLLLRALRNTRASWATHFRTVSALIERVPCFAMKYDDLEWSCRTVQRLFDSPEI